VNNDTSYVSFIIDDMQTWLLGVDYHIMPSFVEREHVTDDTVGANRIDEGLETGEYIILDRVGTSDKDDSSKNLSNMAYLVGLSDLSPITGETDQTIGGLIGNLYSGLAYWFFNKAYANDLRDFIQTYITAGKASAIVFIASIPAFLVPSTTFGRVLPSEVLPSLNIGISKPLTTIDGYTPKNKKLFTYPYNLLYVTNNQGNSSEFRYEEFTEAVGQSDVLFSIIGNISPSPVIQCCPVGYKVGTAGYDGINTEYAISLQNYPLCSWSDDVFREWLVQNGVSTAINILTGLGGTIGGAMSGNALLGGGGITSVFHNMQQLYKASIQPDQAKGNVNAGSLNIATTRQQFYFQKMQIRAEFAQRIDKFFDMFGYKVNTLKVPNIDTRPHWNYVKTVDVTLIGEIPPDAMDNISKIFDTGVTFWKYGSEVGNYALDNSI
jgi:hypothetical protein